MRFSEDRTGRMAGRVGRALDRAGLTPEQVSAVLEVLATSLGHRERVLPEEKDHRRLHPARTVLILLEDVGVRDPALLAAAALLDSRFPGLASPPASWPEALPGDPSTLVRGLPPVAWAEGPAGSPPPPISEARGLPDARLLEELVSLPDPLLALVLAEALDQLRHLHVEPERPRLPRGVELAARVYRPLSRRLGGVLERRFGWWHDTLSRAV